MSHKYQHRQCLSGIVRPGMLQMWRNPRQPKPQVLKTQKAIAFAEWLRLITQLQNSANREIFLAEGI